MQVALRCLEGIRERTADQAVHGGVGAQRRSLRDPGVAAATGKYAAVGDTVNVAARLEELNRDLGTSIVMTGQTIALLRDRVDVRSRGRFTVRGRSRPIDVFELLGLRE
jgi:class 3 adenylate cyclase